MPIAVEMAANETDRALLEFMSSSSELGQTFVAPANVPKNIVDALRRGFDATMKDPEYLAMMKKARNALNPVDGATLTAIVAKALATPKSVIDRYKKAVVIPR